MVDTVTISTDEGSAEPEAGPAMDAEVARVVFGLEVQTTMLISGRTAYGVRGQHPDWPDHVGTPLPYSADTAQGWAAMRSILIRMQELGWHARLTTPFQPGQRYHCGFTPHGTSGWNGRPDHDAGAASMPLAICLAALKAVAAGLYGQPSTGWGE